MSRFRCVKFFAALLAFAFSFFSASQPTPLSAGSSVTAAMTDLGYVVAGDVQNLNTWTLSGSRVTVREAVLKAGLLTEPSSVTVIRRNQERSAWTQLVSTTSSDSGEIVMDGDIIMVQSLNSGQEPRLGNAVLRTDAGSLIVGLADSSVAIGDILQQTQHSVSETMPITLVSRFQGRRTVRKATLFSEVSHGDVISISTTQRKLAGFGNLVPAFSEWQSTAASPAVNSSGMIEQTSATVVANDGQSDARDFEFSRFPDMNTHDQAEALISPVPDDPEFNGNTESRAATTSVNVAPISQTTFPEDLQVLAPAPPVEAPDSVTGNSRQSSGTPGFWNTLFIAALMISGVLIIIGSFLNGDASREASAIQTTEVPAIVPSSNHSFGNLVSIPGKVSNETTAEVGFKMLVSESIDASGESTGAASSSANIPASRPVAASSPEASRSGTGGTPRWFSRDWQQKSAGFSAVVPESVSADTTTTSIVPQSPTTVENPVPARTEIRANVVVDRQGIQASQTQMPLTSMSPEPVESCPGLDDLIENRLPMDLQQAHFPLQITLFGRAAGPRHLRVDAAQPVLTGPHTKFRTATTSGSGSRSVAATSSAMESQGRLDRALSSLEERSES